MWSERAALAAAALGAFLTAASAGAQTPETAASPSPTPAPSDAPAAPTAPAPSDAPAAPTAPAPLQNVQPTPAPSAAPAAPEPVPSPTGNCSADSTCITAGQSERFADGHTQFRGFVDLIFGDTRIQTDRLDIYQMEKPDGTTARRVVAEGNVVFMRGEERLSGEKLDMQLDTSRGTFENAFGYLSPGVLVEAKKIERIGPSEYRIEDGKFTSCMQPSPRWSFSASSADPGGRRQGEGHERPLQGQGRARFLHPLSHLPDPAGPAVDGDPPPALRRFRTKRLQHRRRVLLGHGPHL